MRELTAEERLVTWMRRHGAKERMGRGVTRGRATTAQLRRWLHDSDTPRGIKCQIYVFLQNRRRRP